MLPLAESAGWFFGWLLRNSAHAAILALVVWGLERTLLRRLPPRWRYGLWLMVVARLLVPIAPGSSLSLFNLVDLAPPEVAVFTLQLLGLPVPVPVPLPEVPHPLADTPSWFLGALAFWLPGAAVLAALVWRDHCRLHRALLDTTPVLDCGVLDLLEQSKAVMGVRSKVCLVESPLITSPAISGCRRPRLLLPTELVQRLTTDEARYLFLHELAHVKRADLVLNWVLAVVQVLHWFNPAVWLALRRLLNVREEVCDDLVLRRSFPGASREYGLTLLRLLEECAPRRLVPSLAGILDDVGALRQRIRCIRTFGAPDAHPWLPATITVVLAVTGLTEHKNHHLLFASAPTVDEIRAAIHPTRRARAHPRLPARETDPRLLEPQPSLRSTATPANVLHAISTALRQAVSESRSTDGTHPSGAALTSSTRTSSARGPDGPTATRPFPSQNPSNPGRPGLVSSAAFSLPASTRGVARPYPLPPVAHRGDILRPPRAVDGEGAAPTGRALEVVPYFGRQASTPKPTFVRQSG